MSWLIIISLILYAMFEGISPTAIDNFASLSVRLLRAHFINFDKIIVKPFECFVSQFVFNVRCHSLKVAFNSIKQY